MKMQGKTLVKAPAISYRPESQLLNRPTVIRRPPDRDPSQTVPAASTAGADPKQANSQPKPKLSQEAFWGRYAGQRLTFQCRSGAVITGTFSGVERNFLKLTDAVITGRNVKATTAWTMLDVNSISHFHPDDAVVEAIDGGR